ncbi:MAG: hypothetical protein ACM3JD_01600, partial [Rudaea sp.]
GYNLDLLDTYVLLGDPASRFAAVPKWDQEDPRVQFDGWAGVFDPSASGGSYRINNVPNATAKFPFYGRKVTWITRKGPEEGKAQILIDGVAKRTFDGYSPTPQYNVAMTFGGLTLANHTLTIKVLGNKTNPAATGFAAVIDAFVVRTKRTEESSIGIRNYSLWRGVKSANTFMGTYRSSASRLAYLMFSFDGTEFTWFTAKGPNYGKASITVDGVLNQTVDLYSPKRLWQYPVIIDGLEDKPHTVMINVLGQRNAKSTGNTVIVDGFQFP